MNMFFKAFPDFHETFEDIIAKGDKVWVFLTYTGAYTGEWLGLAPSDKKITCRAIDMEHIVNDKIVEGRRVPTTNLTFFKQLGLIRIHRKRKKTLSRRRSLNTSPIMPLR
jgi:predicted ester cyclase